MACSTELRQQIFSAAYGTSSLASNGLVPVAHSAMSFIACGMKPERPKFGAAYSIWLLPLLTPQDCCPIGGRSPLDVNKGCSPSSSAKLATSLAARSCDQSSRADRSVSVCQRLCLEASPPRTFVPSSEARSPPSSVLAPFVAMPFLPSSFLVSEVLTPDSSRFVRVPRWAPFRHKTLTRDDSEMESPHLHPLTISPRCVEQLNMSNSLLCVPHIGILRSMALHQYPA